MTSDSAAGAGDIEAAAEARVVGEELINPCTRQAAEGAHVRPAARPRHGNDVRPVVVITVHAAHADAARETGVVREKTEQYAGVGAAKGGDVRPAAGPGPDDHVGLAVPVEVARGDGNAGAEAGVV